MKKSRFTEEQIIGVLTQHEAGMKTADLYREHGISAATFYGWKAKYGVMDVSEAQRLKAMEDENRRLKHLVADLSLNQEALKAVIRENGWRAPDLQPFITEIPWFRFSVEIVPPQRLCGSGKRIAVSTSA